MKKLGKEKRLRWTLKIADILVRGELPPSLTASKRTAVSSLPTVKNSRTVSFSVVHSSVAVATFKVIKTEFVWNEKFHTLEELNIKLWDYVNWYNHHRIHSSLGYQTPVQYRGNNLKNLSEKVLTIHYDYVTKNPFRRITTDRSWTAYTNQCNSKSTQC